MVCLILIFFIGLLSGLISCAFKVSKIDSFSEMTPNTEWKPLNRGIASRVTQKFELFKCGPMLEVVRYPAYE